LVLDTSTELFDNGRLIVFTNDFFTIYQDSNSGEMNISLNEIGIYMLIFGNDVSIFNVQF